MYVITVDFVVKPQFKEVFLAAMKKQAHDSLTQEENCTQFDVCLNAEDPNHVFLYEIYSTQADFQDHLESVHFKKFSEAVASWVESKTVKRFSLIAS